ncbi:MAG: uroporphyrinogen decarboxylase [Rubrivivax sp.]|nr:uroporphyrinogen decarboxylase [Rubrivivax sp.]
MQPMTHWQRIEAALRGEPTDRAPVALWRHFPEDDLDPAKLAAHTLAWQRQWDFDLVKFMPSGTYGVEDWGAVTAYRGSANGAREVVKPAVARSDDWLELAALDVRQGSYGRQNQALAAVARELKGEVPLLQTVFSPLTTARKLATEGLFADLRRAPAALEQALGVITEVTIRFALDAIEAGAHGVFLATQLASYRLLSAEEYQRFGKAYDLQVLAALRGKTRLNLLHAHGHDIMFDLLADYPVEMLNWHDRTAGPALAEALSRFPGLLVGGLNENATLLNGSARAIEDEVREALAQTGARRLVLGPGCVVPIAVPPAAIAAVGAAARAAAPA